MQIHSLELKDYRNYDSLELTFDHQVNVILGENAQGKTNLMEAIYVLGMARSHRTPRDKELIRWDQPFARIRGGLSNRRGPADMEVVFSRRGKKVKVNAIEKKRLSEFVGTCTIVMFAPEDLTLVKGSPQVRRRFLDMELGQINNVYLYHLSQYYKILKQRNQWLKELRERRRDSDDAMLDVMTGQLVDAGAEVLLRRFQFLDKLAQWAAPIHQDISRGREELEVSYDASAEVDRTMTIDELKHALHEAFAGVREQEMRRGTTQAGPHRDDLSFFVNGRNIQTYGSQGQQRTTALSLKLAEIELIYEKTGEYPILLLDDVLSELDDHRQTHLLNAIKGRVQTFVTTTSVDGLDHELLSEAGTYYVEEGTIRERS
ncbi:DNA replication/repair protein RecF [Alkalicoccus urumqiensis]|uniref:DNA replication and repair protein RecF n=1 Tax=Alkalicoccus urumqiensis TaxID=1548213 RepID=A0A2P6MDI6_ALKUR|nr:DNA replication/repair protein RecF [Alkalicoccus urumqiensis]PRO64337.1 DNA replication/repair protein RecF [Alkalicoccus urumqiensis]